MSAAVIGFAGMSHLGLVSATAAAERGFSVIAFDTDPSQVASLEAGALPVVEPGLPELLARNRARVTFTSAAKDLGGCDAVYIAADVPTDDLGVSELGRIRALIDAVDTQLAPDAALVILSQVPPGFTRGLAHPPARRFYQVETLVFGAAVERALRPERFIVGCNDPRVPLPPALRDYLGAFECAILPMHYESAELAKISINMLLVASVSATNMLAELCEKTGARWNEIVPALRLDRRIGPHAYLAPGLGIAGGNLERDLATFRELADRHGTDAGIVRAWLANSRHRRDWVLQRVHERVLARNPAATLAVAGLAYKENTASTKNSPSLALLAALGTVAVRAYDPAVPPRSEFHPRLTACSSALEACQGADALIVMTPWREFRELKPADIAARLRGRTIIDPNGVLAAGECAAAGLEYLALGAPPVEAAG